MQSKDKKCEQIEGELLAFYPIIDIPYESFKQIAFAITKLGYRKQQDIIREFVTELVNNKERVQTSDGRIFNAINEDSINELARQYGVKEESDE